MSESHKIRNKLFGFKPLWFLYYALSFPESLKKCVIYNLVYETANYIFFRYDSVI